MPSHAGLNATRIFLALLLSLPTAGSAATRVQQADVKAGDGSAACGLSPAKFALLVGINEYENVRKLTAPVSDVEDVRDVLTGKFCFPAANVKTLTDGEATHDRIISEFRSTLTEKARDYLKSTPGASPSDGAVVVFYFSGHGSQIPDEENGDEPDDHLDETLVTVNSHGRDDKNFSVTDDEIYELARELMAYTSNVTYIIDSCFSGSVTRGEGGVNKKVRIDTRKRPTLRAGQAAKPPDEKRSELLPGDKSYVLITAARSDELAGERILGRRNSILTHHLLSALGHALPETSYWQLWDELQGGVTHDKETQHPQIEGDLTRSLFAGAASREDVFLKAERAGAGTVTLNAGAAQGVRRGSLVALYRPEAKRVSDLERQFCTATVSRVGPTTSTATLDRPAAVPKGARASIISPNLGDEKVRVRLDLGPDASLTPTDRQTSAELSRRIRSDLMLRLASGAGGGRELRWDVAVLRGKFGELFKNPANLAPPKSGEPECPIPPADAEVFYLAVQPGRPLYGFFVQPTCEYRVEKLFRALKQFAARHDISVLKNHSWPSEHDISVTVHRVLGKFEDASGAGGTGSEVVTLPRDSTAYSFDQGELLYFEVANRGDQELYVTVLALKSSGGIEVLYPSGLNPKPIAHGESVFTHDTGFYYETSAPPGDETIKVIVTKSAADFRFLETGGATRGSGKAGPQGGRTSVVGWLMNRADTGRAASAAEPMAWTTADAHLSISAGKQ